MHLFIKIILIFLFFNFRTAPSWVITQWVVVISYRRFGQLIGPIFRGQESKRNYRYSLRNNPEERGTHLLRDGSLISSTIWNFKNKNQIDATYYFIVLLIDSTCFGHYYAHHQELATIMLITTLVVSFLVCCRLEVRCGYVRVVSGRQAKARVGG